MQGKSVLEKCIQEKEEKIKTLIEKVDQININQTNNTTDVILDLKKEILTLKKENSLLHEKNMQQEKEISEIKKENSDLKKLSEEINSEPRESKDKKSSDSKTNINFTIDNFDKCSSYNYDGYVFCVLELNEGAISCMTNTKIDFLILIKTS